MKFSIIVPCYNSELTVATSLHSIKCQTYNDFEVIIIDDGSTDDTGNICKKFASKDHRFKYFYQENKGVSAARNKGINSSQGDFILFLDSDDSYAPEYLSTFNDIINSYNDFNNFWVGYHEVENNNTKTACCASENKLHISKSDRNNSLILPALWNKAFRKSIVDKYNIRMYENLSLGEDFVFNYEYLDVAGLEIAHTDAQVYYYTKSSNDSLDSKYRSDLLEIFKTLESVMYKYFIKWDFNEIQLQRYYEYVFYNRIKVLYNTYRPECSLGRKDKLKFNRKVLRSNEFIEALYKIDCYINPFYKLAYKIGSWRLIQLLDKLVKFKKSK